MAESDLEQEIAAGYGFPDDAVVLGRALTPDLATPLTTEFVQVPLRSLNKHGLVAGATGTGKTKTLQLFAEQLSRSGVPVFLADLKGDLAGLAIPSPGHPKIDERMTGLDIPWQAESFPIEVMSISGAVGTPLRVSVSEFGPLLLAKALDCTDVQESVLQVVFRFADDEGLLLIDLVDLVEVLKFLANDEEGRQAQKDYGGMSTQTLNVLLRKVLELEGQGGEQFFGEPSFDVADLKRQRDGKGVITVLSLVDVQAKPRIFSTFMMWLLAELYESSPEVGDPDQPELVFFFDEAHLIFDGASKALRESIELTVRMIRSKGVGVFFVTQTPRDLPEDVLAQLGNRVQHALRAFTPQDQKALNATAATFPISDHYDVRAALQALGTGEALVTVLNPKGAPTPTVAARFVAPVSTMDPVDAGTLAQLAASSELRARYATEIDRESAFELLSQRAEERAAQAAEAARAEEERAILAQREKTTTRTRSTSRGDSAFEALAKSAARQVGRDVGRSLMRGILGTLTGKR